MKQEYMLWTPRKEYRNNVREPVSNRIIVPLIPLDGAIPYSSEDQDYASLSFAMAMEFTTSMMTVMGHFIKRGDIRDALNSTSAGPHC